MNKAKPIHKGAMKVALCFSTARNKTVRHKIQVPKASKKTPLDLEASPPRLLAKAIGPGVIALAAAAAQIPATSWATHINKPRSGGMALAKTKVKVTAGFKLPPETL
ncbi:hypothetical protein WICPIJ_003864 [Wickerhamomyces pijperi]|uniref:Uncharacterized protein n=1 Tax=Wickerhamomyces pijperi TaxID=599730 RepID=A0A9P8TNC2_WICPI|nr:hypothetical protein WICPIJ_003864 [Wickerhamomyces pijperi]